MPPIHANTTRRVIRRAKAAIGVSATVSVVSANVLPVAHAWVEPNAAEKRKLPAVEASQALMWLRVSEVPPLVHDDAIEVIAFDPAAAAAHVTCLRVASPTAAAVAPAAPGSAVWSLMNVLVGAVNAVPANMSSHLFANVVAARPTAIRTPFVRAARGAASLALR